jgi:hypothetical protein
MDPKTKALQENLAKLPPQSRQQAIETLRLLGKVRDHRTSEPQTGTTPLRLTMNSRADSSHAGC